VHRARFDTAAAADRLRANRTLVKGRFLNGNVGYVFADDLELYATAFRKPVTLMNEIQQAAYDALSNLGPLTPRQLNCTAYRPRSSCTRISPMRTGNESGVCSRTSGRK
jgi:hypothetical protein